MAGEDGVHDRQGRIPGFSQRQLNRATILMIGAGGLGGEIGEGLARKGVGTVVLMDADVVQLSNLNRQRFYECDLYQNKSLALARNLRDEATDASLFIGQAKRFDVEAAQSLEVVPDIVVCGVDNNRTRIEVARVYLARTPVVFLGVDELADHGYVFIQEPKGPCFACLFPHAVRDEGGACARVGAVKDILKVVAGMALYAIDSILMPRKRSWNFREVSLAGFVPDVTAVVQQRKECGVCGDGGTTAETRVSQKAAD